MRKTFSCLCTLWLLAGPLAVSLPAETANSSPTIQHVMRAADRAETLTLPLNRVFLRHQAALRIASQYPGEATQLLLRSLEDIDAAEATLRAKGALDKTTFRDLEFARRPVLMLMIKTDMPRALLLLEKPQSADTDTEFQRLVFEAVAAKNLDVVKSAAVAKLGYGVTPAAIAAYDVLKSRAPDAARVLASSIVQRLGKVDPATDPIAVQAAFALLRLLRNDEGIFAPKIVVDPTVLNDTELDSLFNFLAESFLAAPEPEMLILGESPKPYLLALERYAPTRAGDVEKLPFAATSARSMIFAPEHPSASEGQAEGPELSAEQRKQQADASAQLIAQIRDASLRTAQLRRVIENASESTDQRDAAVFAAVNEANSVMQFARSVSPLLSHPPFEAGELRFYDAGALTGVVNGISSLLQKYAVDRLQIAEQAAQKLDSPEVQTVVLLQIATRRVVMAKVSNTQ